MQYGVAKLVRRAVGVIDDVVEEKGWRHEHLRSMTNEVMAMAVDAVLLPPPRNEWSYLPIRVPGLRAGAQFAVVPPGRAIAEDGIGLVFAQERVNDFVWNETGSWYRAG